MMLYIYDKDSKLLVYQDSGSPENIINDIPNNYDFTLTPPPDYDHVWRWVEDKWVELLPINNPDIPYSDFHKWDSDLGEWVVCEILSAEKKARDQEIAWENVKKKRLELTTAGIYVPSVDKYFHTDEVSSILYSQIGAAISIGVFEPLQWKTMEGDFVELTEELFKEIQRLMIQQTQSIYARAEYHKLMMQSVENPLEYNYDEW